jgi:poly(3-hydroxybutyrate) depolymerase
MTSDRFLSFMGALALLAGACSTEDSGNSTGAGGTTAHGGSGPGGTTASGGSGPAGTTGSRGGSSGDTTGSGGSSSGGSSARGGSGAGTGGTAGTGAVAGSGGTGATSGTGGTAGTAGISGSGGGAPAHGGAGGTASGGATGSAGATGGGSGGGAAGSAGGGGAGDSGAARPSKGCSVKDGVKTLTTGGSSVMSALPTSTRLKITSGGMNREYIIDIPANYDPTHPYRLIFSWHQAYGSDTGNANGLHPANDGPNFDAKNYAYFGLHREMAAANDTAIFIAPGGIGNLPWDYNRDVVLFDDLLALVDANLCIDDSRVFTTGFSFGAMMSYALTLGRPTKLRGAVAMAAANYNFTQPTNAHVAIAYMGTTGMSDGTCPWGNDTMGGKACVLQHAKDNGCTIPSGNNIPTTTAGSKKYLCYDFQGCKPGYPVKVCTFDGPHTPSSVDDGSSTGDDGLKAFIPPLAWKFIAQF